MLAADLHVHLDGSLRAATLTEFALERGMCTRDASGDRWTSDLAFKDGMSLRSCLLRFEATVSLLQDKDALERVAAELVEDCYSDGVRHAEIRLCPLLHTKEGLRPEEALEAALTGIDRAVSALSADTAAEWMSAAVVISILEGMDDTRASLLIDLALRYADRGVLGVDLAGDESLWSADRFDAHFSRARENGLGVTVHAGEAGGPGHVAEAVLKLRADRIGHGTSAARDPAVLELLAERGVTVECCLTSNVHTGAVVEYVAHPLPSFLEAGVRVALATDNRFFSQTSLSREYDIAAERLSVPRSALGRVALESAAASFLPDERKARLERLVASSIEAEGSAAASDPGPVSHRSRAPDWEVDQ